MDGLPFDMGIDGTEESFRIYADREIQRFLKSPEEIYDFPYGLSNHKRRYIHEKCRKLGLKSKSHGKEPNRVLRLTKVARPQNTEILPVTLSPNSIELLNRIQDRCNTFQYNPYEKIASNFKKADFVDKLSIPNPILVRPPNDSPLQTFRKTLPIYPKRAEILRTIVENQIVIISAETGSGKTTQIPQYILEEASQQNKPVRIVCTQPRRLSTISVSERVALERGEQLGSTIGYQIKLESNFSQDTALLYCTNGVLLRTLMCGDHCYKNVTHLIIDEIHERDKFCDFLMICLKESLSSYPNLRVIFMSATMNIEVFQNYFPTSKLLEISGRCFEVSKLFLDDILPTINYENAAMREIRLVRERNGASNKNPYIVFPQQFLKLEEMDATLVAEVGETIRECFEIGHESKFLHLSQLIFTESVSPNFQEGLLGLTPLMVAARHGNIQFLEQLLNMGADAFVTCHEGITASGYAQQFNNFDIITLLSMYQEPTIMMNNTSQIVADYDKTVRDDCIDMDLIVAVITYICLNLRTEGAILIFLPGYDDIMNCKQAILESNIPRPSYNICMLHGSMQTGTQQAAFHKFPQHQRKIILSTNIAETSITIDDVRYIIDTGKVKEKNYDALNYMSSLQTMWISMASTRQRSGRAGRTGNGYCFHLYTFQRYETFSVHTTPEILRVPLHELCLHTKMLTRTCLPIASFLQEAIDPPSATAVNSAIKALKNLGALDNEEYLTPLGNHLVYFSLEPHLGKMLIYSIIFQCLDPILTIVACLAHKDPFSLPNQNNVKAAALLRRKRLSGSTFSDHMILLRVFQEWQHAYVNREDSKFCEENFISSGTMEMIMKTRNQLLSQLRAIGFVLNGPRDNIKDANRNSECWPVIKACLAVSLFPNVAFPNDSKFLHTRSEKHVMVHMSSALRNIEHDSSINTSGLQQCVLIYDEMMKANNANKCFIKCVTAVSWAAVGILCGIEEVYTHDRVLIDNWLEIILDNIHFANLRTAINKIIDKKIIEPKLSLRKLELDIIDCVKCILVAEDEILDLKSIDGIGQRPRIFNTSDNMKYCRHSEQNSNNMNRRNAFRQDTNNHGNWNSKWNNRERELPGPSSSRVQNRYQYKQNKYNFRTHEPYNGHSGVGNNAEASNSAYQNNFHFGEPESILNRLFPVNSKYFIIKIPSQQSIMSSMSRNSWYFTTEVDQIVSHNFYIGFDVVLIYYANDSSSFHGIARLKQATMQERHKTIEWISKNTLDYREVKSFIHPRLHLEADFHELESQIGQQLAMSIYKKKILKSNFTKRF